MHALSMIMSTTVQNQKAKRLECFLPVIFLWFKNLDIFYMKEKNMLIYYTRHLLFITLLSVLYARIL